MSVNLKYMRAKRLPGLRGKDYVDVSQGDSSTCSVQSSFGEFQDFALPHQAFVALLRLSREVAEPTGAQNYWSSIDCILELAIIFASLWAKVTPSTLDSYRQATPT